MAWTATILYSGGFTHACKVQVGEAGGFKIARHADSANHNALHVTGVRGVHELPVFANQAEWRKTLFSVFRRHKR